MKNRFLRLLLILLSISGYFFVIPLNSHMLKVTDDINDDINNNINKQYSNFELLPLELKFYIFYYILYSDNLNYLFENINSIFNLALSNKYFYNLIINNLNIIINKSFFYIINIYDSKDIILEDFIENLTSLKSAKIMKHLVNLLKLKNIDLNKDTLLNGFLSLTHAVNINNILLLKALIACNCDINIFNTYSVLKILSDQEKNYIEQFLSTKFSANSKRCGITPLMIAIYNNCYDIIKILIKNGADLNVQDICGNTALLIAAKKNNTDIVNILLLNGADVEIKNFQGKSLFDYY